MESERTETKVSPDSVEKGFGGKDTGSSNRPPEPDQSGGESQGGGQDQGGGKEE